MIVAIIDQTPRICLFIFGIPKTILVNKTAKEGSMLLVDGQRISCLTAQSKNVFQRVVEMNYSQLQQYMKYAIKASYEKLNAVFNQERGSKLKILIDLLVVN